MNIICGDTSMNFLKHLFTKFEPVEQAAMIDGHVRYWTEMQPVGIDWMTVAGALFILGSIAYGTLCNKCL